MNIDRLNNCIKFFEEEPLRLDMSDWLKTNRDPNKYNPPCGTVACLAGSALVLSARERGLNNAHLWNLLGEDTFTMFGARYFDISIQQADNLFLVGCWPTIYRLEYEHFESEFKRYEHPHILSYIKKQMVRILKWRVRDFIQEVLQEDERVVAALQHEDATTNQE